jgi:hypothetical protein
MPKGKTYVIYYGWLSDDRAGAPNAAAQAIAANAVPLLIAHFRTAPPAGHTNLSAQVMSLMRGAGTQVFAYIPTAWGRADANRALRDIDEYLAAGVDGIFFDEVDSLCSDPLVAYYASLASAVRERGGHVIVNAGVARCGERIMEVCDLLMVEHAWRDVRTRSLWLRRYPEERVMGVSSNEASAMGYAVDAQRAVADTEEAWRCGIGWHTSTDRFIELPEWFASYGEALAGRT